MGFVAVIAAVALAGVFVVSGVAKLLDRDGTREAVIGFGIPPGLASAVAGLLAPVELTVALLLVVPATVGFGAGLAVALLTAFTVAVGWALRQGRRPECHCFGRLGGSDVSGRTVARNVTLIGLAALALLGDVTGERPTGLGLAAAAAAGVALAVAVLAAEAITGRRARAAREAAEVASFDAQSQAFEEGLVPAARRAAPEFRLPTLAGGDLVLSDLLASGSPLLLVVLSPGCGPCKRIRPEVAQWAQLLQEKLTVAVLATGGREANEASYTEFPHLTVLLDENGVRDELGAAATPSAVLIDSAGMVASPVAVGEALVRKLLVQALTGVEVGSAELAADDGVPADTLDLTTRVTPRPTVQAHPLGESTMLLDTESGATVVLDQLGMLVWSVLDGSPLQEIVTDLVEAFGAPADTVASDVLQLARTLGEAGLLAGVAPATHAHGHHAHAHAGEPAG